MVPVHLKFELVHLLIGFEDLVLDIIQPILLICDSLLEFFYFIFQTTTLTLSDLLEMLFSFDFFIFGVHQTLGMNELHLDGLEVLV